MVYKLHICSFKCETFTFVYNLQFHSIELNWNELNTHLAWLTECKEKCSVLFGVTCHPGNWTEPFWTIENAQHYFTHDESAIYFMDHFKIEIKTIEKIAK